MSDKKKDFPCEGMPNKIKIIFISNKEEEEMYDEWYDFLGWHKTNLNFVEYKLRTGEDFDRKAAIHFFKIDEARYCFCVRRGKTDYDFYINSHDVFLNFKSSILKVNVYTIKIGAKTPWERIKGTYDRVERDTVADDLYGEISDWLLDNSDEGIDIIDHPYLHDALDDYSYTRILTIVSSREKYVKEFYLKYYNRIIECEKQMRTLDFKGSWLWQGISDCKFIWCEITKPNLDFDHSLRYNRDDKFIRVSF